MKVFAVLNKHKHLVGKIEVDDEAVPVDGQVAIDPGDLALNGSYKWDPELKAFLPLGWGLGFAATRGPTPETMVLYYVVRAVWDAVPQEVRDWATWYEQHRRERDERAVFSQRRHPR